MIGIARCNGRTPRRAPALIGALLLLAAGCEFLDPTKVTNPRTTPEDLAQAGEPVRALMPGLRAQFGRVLASTAVIAEVVSDNYSVQRTGLNAALDNPRGVTPDLVNSTSAVTGIYWNSQELRALANFVLDSIRPIDPDPRPQDVTEAHYYRGMAYLLLAENFVAAPLDVDELPVPGSGLLARAIAELETAAAGAGPFTLHALAALARAHRVAGDPVQAAAAAAAVLAADPAYVFAPTFDPSVTSISNGPWIFIVLRALKEMQPLPRLDFLDPKYTVRQAPIPVHKAEEMLLILAERDMAAGDWAGGREWLAQAVELARARPTETFFDDDLRLSNDLRPRPRDAEMTVAADAASPFRAGLVLTRQVWVTENGDRTRVPVEIVTPTVSGTSLDPEDIRAIDAADTEQLFHTLWLARQEILMIEGRRMADLCIKLPMMLREINANRSIDEGDFGTVVFVPSWIPPSNQMDLFSPASPYEADGETFTTTEITILHDMNGLLAANRAPFSACPAPPGS